MLNGGCMRPTVVFVHGAFVTDSQWWWHRVDELLTEQGIQSRTIDLPSVGEAPPLGDLHDDSAAVRELIDSIDGQVILVGHSYGGMVISEAGANNPKVGHLLYISAVVPDGWSVIDSDYVSDEKKADPSAEVEIREDGTVGEGQQRFKTKVLESLPNPTMTNEAVRRLSRQSLQSFSQVPDGHAWRDKPSTYILCLDDGDVAIPEQRKQASRTKTTVEVPTNHFAHLERPDLVADVIAKVADQLEKQPEREPELA